jgi:hypothetical protein
MFDEGVQDHADAVVSDRWRERRNISYTQSVEGCEVTSVQLLDKDGRRIAAIRRQFIVVCHPSRGPAFRKIGPVEYVLADGRQLTPRRNGRSFRVKGTRQFVALRLERHQPARDGLAPTSNGPQSEAAQDASRSQSSDPT